jgi:hypothetical protein
MPGPHPSHSRDPPGVLSRNTATRHNPEPGMLQSIFSPAARRQDTQIMRGALRRDGGLKMDWTKPLHWRPMGIESAVVSTNELETASIS